MDYRKEEWKPQTPVSLPCCITGRLWSRLTLPAQTPPLTIYLHWVIRSKVRHSHCRTPSMATSRHNRKVCVSFTLYLSLKKQTCCSHFHSFKSPSAYAHPNITRCAHLHWAVMTLIKRCSNTLKPQLRTRVSPSPSLPVRASNGQGPSVGLEAPEHCAAGDLRNRAEVCCSHHSSAVMNSADH